MVNRLRTYKVWIKGKKELTATEKTAPTAELARIRFARSLNLKSFEVEAVWMREVPSMPTGYVASR